jgi:hypothetical protein
MLKKLIGEILSGVLELILWLTIIAGVVIGYNFGARIGNGFLGMLLGGLAAFLYDIIVFGFLILLMNIRDDIQKIQKRVRNLEKVICNTTTDDTTTDDGDEAPVEKFPEENGKVFATKYALTLKRGVATDLAVCAIDAGESVTLSSPLCMKINGTAT